MNGPTMPEHVQQSRKAGSSIGNAKSVTRPHRWGNPHTLGPDRCQASTCRDRFVVHSRRGAVDAYRRDLLAGNLVNTRGEHLTVDDARNELRGRSLACFCQVGEPCHADALLEIANGGEA